MSLPPLRQVVTADTGQFDRALGNATSSLRRFAGPAGLALAAGAIATMTARSMQNVDALTKQARSLGLTTRAFQAMSLVAKEAGVSSGQLSQSLGLMQRQIIELERGTKASTEAFGQLGLSLRDLQGLSPDQQFERIAASLSRIEDPARRTATAMQIFGR
jgi:DNA-binding phage protein